MRIFLTGATGFIGSEVARALVAEGDDVHALVRPGSALLPRLDDLRSKLSIVPGDLARPAELGAALRDLRPEACIHLAWYVEPGKYLTSPANTEMLSHGIRLAQLLADAGCKRLVGAGTNFEYASDAGWLSEESPTKPNSLYAASKLALFQVLEQTARLTGTSFAWARIFYQYGPHEGEQRLVPAVILPLLRGEESRVTAGEQVRDFLHVADVARAITTIAKSDVTGAVNVGSGIPVTVRDLCLTIQDIVREFGGRGTLSLGAIPYRTGDPMFVCANAQKLRGLGFRPSLDLNAGIEQTVRWWKARLDGASR